MSQVLVQVVLDNPAVLSASNLQAILNGVSGISVSQAFNASTGYGYSLTIDTSLGNQALTSMLNDVLHSNGMNATGMTVTPVATTQQAVDNSQAASGTLFGFPTSYVLIGGAALALLFMMKEK